VAFSDVTNDVVTEIYKSVTRHINLQMCKRNTISIKYTLHYSYAKFWMFYAPPAAPGM